MVWNNNQTKLLLLQKQHPDSERRLSNGCTFTQSNSRDVPTAHRAQHMAQLSAKHKIINYFRCVDDILIIFDPSHSNIQAIVADFNTLRPKLQFTAKAEKDNAINYLDVNIHRTPSGWKTAVCRKPTSTDTIIPYTSNHPPQHKYAAIRFLYKRLHTYNLQPTEYLQEENTIHNILYKNGFPIKQHKPQQPKPQKQWQNTHMQTHKLITFT